GSRRLVRGVQDYLPGMQPGDAKVPFNVIARTDSWAARQRHSRWLSGTKRPALQESAVMIPAPAGQRPTSCTACRGRVKTLTPPWCLAKSDTDSRTPDMVRTFTQSEQAADTVILAGPSCIAAGQRLAGSQIES